MLLGAPDRHHAHVLSPGASEETEYRARCVWIKSPRAANYEYYVVRTYAEAFKVAVAPRVQRGAAVVQYARGPEALAAMAPHGVLEVLRPYAATQDPFAIAPLLFEQGLKHHCIADMLVTIFDEMVYEASSAVAGVLTDGRRRWSVTADHMIDVSELPTELNSAIVAGAAAANSLVDSFTARRPRTSG